MRLIQKSLLQTLPNLFQFRRRKMVNVIDSRRRHDAQLLRRLTDPLRVCLQNATRFSQRNDVECWCVHVLNLASSGCRLSRFWKPSGPNTEKLMTAVATGLAVRQRIVTAALGPRGLQIAGFTNRTTRALDEYVPQFLGHGRGVGCRAHEPHPAIDACPSWCTFASPRLTKCTARNLPRLPRQPSTPETVPSRHSPPRWDHPAS